VPRQGRAKKVRSEPRLRSISFLLRIGWQHRSPRKRLAIGRLRTIIMRQSRPRYDNAALQVTYILRKRTAPASVILPPMV
jgi:hypothetical protein